MIDGQGQGLLSRNGHANHPRKQALPVSNQTYVFILSAARMGYHSLCMIASPDSPRPYGRRRGDRRRIDGAMRRRRAQGGKSRQEGNQSWRRQFTTWTGNAPSPQPPAFPSGSPATSMVGLFLLMERRMRGAPTQGQVHMPTWREDALRGATLGLLISLGVVLLLGGVVYWL